MILNVKHIIFTLLLAAFANLIPVLANNNTQRSCLNFSLSMSQPTSQPWLSCHDGARDIPIRILLAAGLPNLDINLPSGGSIKNTQSGETIAELPAQSHFQVYITTLPSTQEKVVVLAAADSTRYLPVSSYYISPAEQQAFVGFKGQLYRGKLVVMPTSQSRGFSAEVLKAINELNLEDYLLSAVPADMPANWPAEALKAQAIAARSYALANLGKHATAGYDLKATVEDQVYLGIRSETKSTNSAVYDTQRLVLKHHGKIISAFYHSTSGGYTDLAENVWHKPVSFLQAVPDYDDASPYFRWKKVIPVPYFEELLKKTGKDVGDLLMFFPLSRSWTNRIKTLLVAGSAKILILSGEEIRQTLNLPSTAFTTTCREGNYLFTGRGFGHGLGLSQWGAKFLAEHGYNASQILSYYYKEVTVEQF